MEKLNIPIEQSGYGVNFNFDIASAEFGVASRSRRNVFNTWLSVPAIFLCELAEYQYLADFYKRFAASGGVHFLVDVISEDQTILEMKAAFKRGSFRLTSVTGNLYRVSAMLSVKPIRYDTVNRPFVVDQGLLDKALDAETGYFVLSGFAAGSIRAERFLHAETGYFTITGTSLNRAGTGYFVLTGFQSNPADDEFYRITEDNVYRIAEDGEIREIE